MNIRFLGAHNRESHDSRFVCLLIDDVLAIDTGCLTSSLSLEAQRQLKAILLTHQHYDHIRDVPAIAINLFFHGGTINIYSNQTVYDTISAHLLNGKVYPKFLELPETNPTVKFTVIGPHRPEQIADYNVLAVPVNHNDDAFGYQITSSDGKTIFYTGDTGVDLKDCWAYISPQLLIIEVTLPNRYQELAQETGHLTPNLLKQELVNFRELKGYLPSVVLVHMDSTLEEDIRAEIDVVANTLNAPITLAYEGMQLHL